MTTITILKFISLTLTGAFATMQVLTDYKKDGRVTKWGKIATIGVVITTLCSLGLLGLEQKSLNDQKLAAQIQATQDKDEANRKFQASVQKLDDIRQTTETNLATTNDAAHRINSVGTDLQSSIRKQAAILDQTKAIDKETRTNIDATEATLKSANRAAHPIGDLGFKLKLIYSLKDPIFQPYVGRLRSAAADSIATYGKKRSLPMGLNARVFLDPETNYQPSTIEIRPGSKLFPDGSRPNEAAAANSLNSFDAFVKVTDQGMAQVGKAIRDEGVEFQLYAANSGSYSTVVTDDRDQSFIVLEIDFRTNEIHQYVQVARLSQLALAYDLANPVSALVSVFDMADKDILIEVQNYLPQQPVAIGFWQMSYGIRGGIRQYINLNDNSVSVMDDPNFPSSGRKTLVMRSSFEESDIEN